MNLGDNLNVYDWMIYEQRMSGWRKLRENFSEMNYNENRNLDNEKICFFIS